MAEIAVCFEIKDLNFLALSSANFVQIAPNIFHFIPLFSSTITEYLKYQTRRVPLGPWKQKWGPPMQVKFAYRLPSVTNLWLTASIMSVKFYPAYIVFSVIMVLAD